jgi:hypothetical protein
MTEPSRTTSALKHAVLIVVAIVMMAPFVWMVLASFKTLGDIESGSAIPAKWQPQNYADVFKDPDVSSKVNFSRYYFNSLFRRGVGDVSHLSHQRHGGVRVLAIEMARARHRLHALPRHAHGPRRRHDDSELRADGEVAPAR